MKVVYTDQSKEDLRRLRAHIGHNPPAARRAAAQIKSTIRRIQRYPLLGHPVADADGLDHDDLRDVVIPFGARSYVMRYQVLPDRIRLLRLWHALEDRS